MLLLCLSTSLSFFFGLLLGLGASFLFLAAGVLFFGLALGLRLLAPLLFLAAALLFLGLALLVLAALVVLSL